MSRKEKTIVLYSRNGIKISRIDYLDMTKYTNIMYANKCIKDSFTSVIENKELIKGKPAWTEHIRHESPLGFYYYVDVYHGATSDQLIQYTAHFVKYIAGYGTSRYEFIYPTKFRDITINRETRPWDLLPGYKGMPDHFINDLYKEINKMLDVWETERIPYRISKASYNEWSRQDEKYAEDMSWINDVRKDIYLDIFGDKNGPSVNYNDINIVRHGFDLKESFRKRKEDK